ncbi:MAG: hypothetical protein R3B83_01800 [Nitrospirales bacterium]|nr:hypothetical protein [Nitrospirales bacterium]
MVREVDTWAHVPPDIQPNHQALYFVGWDQWGPDALQWLIRFNPVQKEADSATIFLILPSDHAIDHVRAVQRGADGFISYPYSLSNLRQNIQTIRRDLAIHFPPFFPHFDQPGDIKNNPQPEFPDWGSRKI